jgi:hypothetical protein
VIIEGSNYAGARAYTEVWDIAPDKGARTQERSPLKLMANLQNQASILSYSVFTLETFDFFRSTGNDAKCSDYLVTLRI